MSTAGHHFCFGSASSFFLEPFLQSSPVAYWTPTDLDGSSFSAISFLFFSYCSWGSQGRNADVVCHCLPQWTTFRQNSPPWFVHVGWPDMAWLIQAVIHVLILVSFLWLWLSFCLPSVEEDKRFVQAFWWERLAVGKAGSCSVGKLGLALWAGPRSANLSSNFLLMDGAVLPLCSLAWGSPVLESGILYARVIASVLGLMMTSSKRTYVNMLPLPGRLLPGPLTPQQAPAEACLHLRLLNTHRLV